MARPRRRRKMFWFPNLGTVGPDGNADDDDYALFLQLTIDTGQTASSTFVTDLTFDRPIEEDEGSDTLRLSSVVGGEYILRRIVGNCMVSKSVSIGAGAAESGIILVTAGFFVARAEDSSNEDITNRQPIGAETTAELRENYSPASVSTVREPWIWRKRWVLGNNPSAGTSGFVTASRPGFLASAPGTNVQYPSKHTDASIDAKTIRRVGNDNRLWFSISARMLNAGSWLGEGASPFVPAAGTANVGSNVQVILDYRLLGHLTRTRSTGTF